MASAGPYANDLHLLQTDNHTNMVTPSLNLYMPDALPDNQPTVSKHRKQLAQFRLFHGSIIRRFM